ncbi:MAG: lipopolysaccharide heptosyltransferase II [Candidatus Omnitrophica bacterium]|nr:lipopolysaccharide heptosyltransferase II [Candidatus Omnitrophota bacterium]
MNRVLVIVPNWFGEALFTTPFVRALRRQSPQAHIAALGWPQAHDVLLNNPHLNELIVYDERAAHRSLGGKWRLVGQLRRRAFDTAFILRKSLSRTLLMALAGIPARIGFDHPKSGWLLTRRVAPSDALLHKAATYLPLLSAVGLRAEDGPYEYQVTEHERAQARLLLARQGVAADRPLVVLHPGANWPHKRWLPERFAALGTRLIETQRAQIVVTGGPDDAPLAQALQRQMRHPALRLDGQTTLRQLAACLEQAHLVVSNDTGVLHIAAALGRPVVALYGPTSPQLTGPLGDPSRIIVAHHPNCPQVPCYSPEHPPHDGMASITVDEVYAASCQLLERGVR